MTIDTRDIEGCESAALAREHDEQVRVLSIVDQSDRDPSEVEGHLASPGAGVWGEVEAIAMFRGTLLSRVSRMWVCPEGCEV